MISSRRRLPQAGDHVVAYRALKRWWLFLCEEVVGRNEAFVAKFETPHPGEHFVSFAVSVSGFESGHAFRDLRTREILKHQEYPFIYFESQIYPTSFWKSLREEKTTIQGQMIVMNFKAPVTFQAQRVGNTEVRGEAFVSFQKLGMQPPSFLWGIESQVLNDFELHFNVLMDKVEGLVNTEEFL